MSPKTSSRRGEGVWTHGSLGHTSLGYIPNGISVQPYSAVLERQANNMIVQSNLATGRVAGLLFIGAVHDRSPICQVAPMCTRPPHTIPWTHSTYHPKRQINRFSCFCMADATFSLYITIAPPHFPKNYSLVFTMEEELDPI